MNILWWQILLLTLYAGYQILDELQIYSSLSAPVFAGLFAGLVMGDIKAGLIIGGSMQLTVLGVGTFGGASKIDANSGTILATAFSVSLGMNPEQAIAAIAVPVASLMIQLDILARFANTYFAHRIDKMVEDMNYKGIERNFLMGALPWSLSRMIPVFLALAFGGGLVQKSCICPKWRFEMVRRWLVCCWGGLTSGRFCNFTTLLTSEKTFPLFNSWFHCNCFTRNNLYKHATFRNICCERCERLQWCI